MPDLEDLRRAHRLQGGSYSELARRAGLNRDTVADVMNGKARRPHPATIEKLAKVLDVDGNSWPAEREWVVTETVQTRRTWIVRADTAFTAARKVKTLNPDKEETAQVTKETTDRRLFHG